MFVRLELGFSYKKTEYIYCTTRNMVEINEVENENAVDLILNEWEKKNANKPGTKSSENARKEGEPELPPQITDVASKPTEEIMEELNKLPFFMNELKENDSGGNSVEIEALKALAYEGEPDEIAENFKKQGNDCYKARKYNDAVEYYTKGLNVLCGLNNIDGALYLNRAACNLELKNYRRCINDCKECLALQPDNVKALFRSSKAFFAIGFYDEARQLLDQAHSIDEKNIAVNYFKRKVDDKIQSIKDLAEEKKKEEEAKLKIEINLQEAIKLRNLTTIHSSYGSETIGNAKLHLEYPNDLESQLIIPTMILYPTTDEFDVISEVSELSTPFEVMELVMNRPESYFADGKHNNFRSKNLEAYMETEDGGLVKVGKKVAINQALMSQKPKIPLFDNVMRIYFVPKLDSQSWLSTWNKKEALNKRA